MANFLGAVSVANTPAKVALNGDRTVGTLVFNNSTGGTGLTYVIEAGTAGSRLIMANGGSQTAINVLSGNHAIATTLSIVDSTDVTVAAGSTLAFGSVQIVSGKTLAVKPGSHITAMNLRGGTLNIEGTTDSTSRVEIDASHPRPQGTNGNLSILETLIIAHNGGALGSRSYFGTLDLGNNDLVIRNGNLAEVEDLIRAGRTAGFSWDGKGLTSSEAASGVYAGVTGLGVIQNDYGDGTPVHETWGGVAVTTSDILVKYTWYGDANLDGLVEGLDFSLLGAGYSGAGTGGWLWGDFDLSGGAIGDLDFSLLGAGFTGSRVEGDLTLEQSKSLPEPGLMGLLAIGSLGLLRRRNRHP